MSRLLLILSSGIFLACTSESKIKTLILDQSQASFDEFIKAEAEKAVTGKAVYKANYFSAVHNRTEFAVESIDVHGSKASASVQVLSVAEKVRGAVLEILEKRPNDNGYSMNMSDAVHLVNGQMKLGDEPRPVFKYVYKLSEDGSDWKIVSQEMVAPKK